MEADRSGKQGTSGERSGREKPRETRKPPIASSGAKDFLVGVLPSQRDLDTLLRDGWYRIPASVRTGEPWPPRWLGFYEGKPLREDRGIYKFAEVLRVERRSREELFPGEPSGSKQGKLYHVLHLGPIHERPAPVRFPRPRRFAFIRTTVRRFSEADTVNDLFADSWLEDQMWQAFKERKIPAERQWHAPANGRTYLLDFAVFCRGGKIDVETDGDSYHITTTQAPRDNQRNNDLATRGWEVLRYGTKMIEQYLEECVGEVLQTVDRLKGFESAKLVPTRYIKTASGMVPQLSMFEQREEYDAPDDGFVR